MRALLMLIAFGVSAGASAVDLEVVITRNSEALGGLQSLDNPVSWRAETVTSKDASLLLRWLQTRDGEFLLELAQNGPWTTMGFSDISRCWIRPRASAGTSDCNEEPGGPLVVMRMVANGFSLHWMRRQCPLDYSLVTSTDAAAPHRVHCGVDEFMDMEISIDPQSWLVLSTDMTLRSGARTERAGYEYDDYRRVGGILWPHTTRMTEGGATVFSTTIRSVEFDPPVDRAKFLPPTPGDN